MSKPSRELRATEQAQVAGVKWTWSWVLLLKITRSAQQQAQMFSKGLTCLKKEFSSVQRKKRQKERQTHTEKREKEERGERDEESESVRREIRRKKRPRWKNWAWWFLKVVDANSTRTLKWNSWQKKLKRRLFDFGSALMAASFPAYEAERCRPVDCRIILSICRLHRENPHEQQAPDFFRQKWLVINVCK